MLSFPTSTVFERRIRPTTLATTLFIGMTLG